jgi:TolA-binding protein
MIRFIRNASRPLTLAGVLAIAPLASADELKVNLNGDDVPFPKVRVTALREGLLYFQTAAGAEKSVPLEELVSMKVDKYPEYEQATAAISAKDFKKAESILAPLYKKAPEEYMKVLAGARLVYVQDWSGRFTDAVKTYLELIQIERGPFAANVRPRNYPKTPADRAAAAKFVETVLRSSTDQLAQEQLKEILDNLKEEVDAPGSAPANPADPSAANPGMPAPPPPPGTAQNSKDPVGDLINSKQYQKALDLIEEKKKGGGQLSTLIYQQGLAEAGLGKDLDAALSFMRVVVHFPRSDTATNALVEAGKIMQKIGRNDKAKQLWIEAKDRAKDNPDLMTQIDTLLSSVK